MKYWPKSRRGLASDRGIPTAPMVSDLAKRLAAIEDRLLLTPESMDEREYSDLGMAKVAERIYRSRRRRARHFPPLFAEPAWDMLLDLFIARVRGKAVSTTSLALAGDVPATTGLRWIRLLERNGLLERYSTTDRRVTCVMLADRGYRVMRQYLIEGVEAHELPPVGGPR